MRFSLVTCLVLAITHSPVNAEELTSAENAARDFSYLGLRIGTSRDEFHELFREQAKLSIFNSAKIYTAEYDVKASEGRSFSVGIYHGKIYTIAVDFTPKMLSDIAGVCKRTRRPWP